MLDNNTRTLLMSNHVRPNKVKWSFCCTVDLCNMDTISEASKRFKKNTSDHPQRCTQPTSGPSITNAICQLNINYLIHLLHALFKEGGRGEGGEEKSFQNSFVCQSLINCFITTYNCAMHSPFMEDVARCVVCSLTPRGTFSVYSTMALHSMQTPSQRK